MQKIKAFLHPPMNGTKNVLMTEYGVKLDIILLINYKEV